jgi:hypothetical protein
MTELATKYNADGELHANVYRYPVNELTPLRYANGAPTGAWLVRSNLLYPDGMYQAQLDYKELVSSPVGTLVFQRGGYVPDAAPVPYGHILKADISDHIGSPVPAGGGRGAPAPLNGRTVTVSVQPIPLELRYKGGTGSSYMNAYGDPAATYGFPGAWTYQTWSTVRTEAGTGLGRTVDGGGIVRALLPNGGHVNLCDVQRIHAAAVDTNGVRNGTVTFAHAERSNLYGWLVVAHQVNGQPEVHHII